MATKSVWLVGVDGKGGFRAWTERDRQTAMQSVSAILDAGAVPETVNLFRLSYVDGRMYVEKKALEHRTAAGGVEHAGK